MNKPNDGGPAYPTGYVSEGGNSGGMTLRDYFASQEQLSEYDHPDVNASRTLCELLAGPMPSEYIEQVKWEALWRAKLKFIRADAMIRARDKT